MIKNIYNLGDAALYCDFGDTVNKETNLKVINYFKDIRKKKITGVGALLLSSSCSSSILSILLSGAKDHPVIGHSSWCHWIFLLSGFQVLISVFYFPLMVFVRSGRRRSA